MSITQFGMKTYECMECGNRVRDDSRPGECPKCGGEIQNLGKPREQ